MHFDGQQQSCACGMRVPQVFDLPRSSLTNRMTELVTYGSVGASGESPAPTRQ